MALARDTPGVVSAARWFWWIAGLSVVNSVLMHTGSETSFIVGLGFTLLADALFQSMKLIAFGIDTIAVGLFVVLGYYAGRGQLWAFIAGGFLYLVDAAIYVVLQAWLPVAFHAWVLFTLFRGFTALRAALRAAPAPVA